MCVCVCVYYPSKLDGKSNYDEFSVKNLKQSVFSFPSRVTRNTKKKKKNTNNNYNSNSNKYTIKNIPFNYDVFYKNTHTHTYIIYIY